MRIQHNIMAMNAYRNLGKNNGALNKNLEKLSSGYRINRAGDDAAGLAISEKMRAQIAGLDQAQKNAQSGINMVQTAEGALTEVHDMLNRMVTLTTQAANGTYTETDRAKIQSEIDALTNEIDRIADNSNFNGTKLLDGALDASSETKSVESLSSPGLSPTNAAVEGKDAVKGEFTIDLSQLEITTTSTGTETVTFNIGTFSFAVSVDSTAAVTAGTILNALNATTTATFAANGMTFDIATGTDKITFKMQGDPTSTQLKTAWDMTIDLGTTQATHNFGHSIAATDVTQAVAKTNSEYAVSRFTLGSDDDSITDGKVVQIGNEKYVFAVGKDSKFKDAPEGCIKVDLTEYKDDVSNTKDLLNQAGAALTKAAAGNDKFIVSYQDGGTVNITEKDGGLDHDTELDDNKEIKAELVQVGSITSQTTTGSGTSMTLQIGADKNETINVNIKSMKASALGIDALSVANETDAKNSLDKINAAIEKVSVQRSNLGAVQNRLEHTINNLGVMEENIQDAEANIRDTDIADEMMAYTKNNILIQSAQAMLAQANQVPQGVLQLMG